MARSRERRILVATALLAAGVPAAAYALVHARTAALAEHLGAAGGVPVRIGAVDADLTGSIRLSDVAFGELISADAIEASVALDSLLAGELRADEIQIASPRVAIEIDADGDSNLARLARRLAGSRPAVRSPSASRSRLRRIVVTQGSLSARVSGIGEVTADGVELVPDAGGVRVITGAVRLRGAVGDADLELGFERSAAEVALPAMNVGRVLAVGGRGAARIGDRSIALDDVIAGRLAASRPAPFEVRATIDDAGIARPVSLELLPGAATLRGEHVPLAGLAALAPSAVQLDRARASGTLRVQRERGQLAVEADGTLANVAVAHATLAASAIPVTAAVRATVLLGQDGLSVSRFEVDSGAIHARASGWLRRGTATTPLSGQVDLAIASAPCADLLASVPIELRGPLDGLTLAGDLGVMARLTIDLAAPAGDGAALAAELAGGCTALAEPPAADVTTLRTPPENDEGWVPFSKIPDRVRGAFVSAEDGRFWSHDGFDLQQIARSFEIDLRERRLARGGSTISQQLVKNVFLTHRRTLDRKLQEAVLTWRLEARLDKPQILERYLNIIELGPRVHGIGAAARHWFDTTPRGLTIRQAAFLAAITSEPTSMSRRVRRHGGLDPVSAERVATILRAMRRDGVITTAEHDDAKGDGMSFAPAAIRADR